jgi:hypothetical protein
MHALPRPRLLLLAAFVALLSLVAATMPPAGAAPLPVPGAGSCDPPDPCGYDGQQGLQVELRTIGVVTEPKQDEDGRSLDLYEALLPNGLEMPDEPLVGVWLVDIAAPRGADLRPYDGVAHWAEGAIQLRATHVADDGTEEEGWYPISYPVHGELWYQLGIAVGLPKYRATQTTTVADGAVTMSARSQGAEGGPSVLLSWSPEDVGEAEHLDLAARTALDPFFTLNDPLEGPDLMRVQYSVEAPMPPFGWLPDVPAFDEEHLGETGMVYLRLDPDIDTVNTGLPDIVPDGASLSDLIDTAQALPGIHRHAAATLGSDSRTIGTGGYDR